MLYLKQGDVAPDLQKRREKKSTSTPAEVFDDRIYFGAAYDKRQASKNGAVGHTNMDDEVDVEEEDVDDYTTASFVEDDDDDKEDGEDSESLLDSTQSLNDSLDLASLVISHTGNTTPQKMTPKKTPIKAPRVVPAITNCKINLQESDPDRDIIAPDIFLYNGRKAAAVTVWIPNHYSDSDVSAFVNDGGRKVTLEFHAPKEFLTTINQAATNDATVGSSLGEAYATFIQNLPSSSTKKLVIDLPFQAEERLCPEVLGKSAFAAGIDIIDVDLGNGKNGRQIILAVREVLRDDLKRESVGRRVFRGSAGGGQQQQQQQQYHHQEDQHHTSNQQQQYQHRYEHDQRRTRVRRHDEIGIVGDHDIGDSNT